MPRREPAPPTPVGPGATPSGWRDRTGHPDHPEYLITSPAKPARTPFEPGGAPTAVEPREARTSYESCEARRSYEACTPGSGSRSGPAGPVRPGPGSPVTGLRRSCRRGPSAPGSRVVPTDDLPPLPDAPSGRTVTLPAREPQGQGVDQGGRCARAHDLTGRGGGGGPRRAGSAGPARTPCRRQGRTAGCHGGGRVSRTLRGPWSHTGGGREQDDDGRRPGPVGGVRWLWPVAVAVVRRERGLRR